MNVDDLSPYTPLLLLALLLLHGVASSLRRAHRARLRGDSYRDELTADGELRAGDAIVAGRVAYAQDAGEAMRVDLEQVGREAESSGAWSHVWTETSRTLTVRPFYLVQGAGPAQRRIRVEPTQASQLFDSLDRKILVSIGVETDAKGASTWRRLRSATLLPEERVWAVGRLARDTDPEAQAQLVGYREHVPTQGWVLRGAPTLLVSSVPLVGHFRERARLHRGQALLCALLLLFPAYFLAARLDRVHGESVVGAVTAASSHTDDENRTTFEAEVEAGGRSWTSETLTEAPAVGQSFRLRVGRWTSNDGVDVHWTGAEIGALGFGLFAAVGVRLALRAYSRRRLPWFRSTKPHVDTGSGRLTRQNATA